MIDEEKIAATARLSAAADGDGAVEADASTEAPVKPPVEDDPF